MPRKRPYRAITSIDPAELAAFQAEIRRRYSDEEILEQLRESAKRLGRSPTMKEFADDPETTVHPQTVIEHFGSWNKAKRLAGLVPRRFATREELLGLLQELGKRLGRVPTAKDVDANRGWMPSKSLYWHTFGSLTNALKEAGFDVPVGEERLERAIEQGAGLARQPRAAAEVQRLGGGAPRGCGAADRVAGLPHVRRAAGGVVDVPVPRPRASPRRGCGGRAGRLVEAEAAKPRPERRAARGRTRLRAGARTAGSGSASYVGSGLKRSRRTARGPFSASSVPSATSRLRRRTPV